VTRPREPRRLTPLEEDAVRIILAAAKLEPDQEPPFRNWLAEIDAWFLDEQARLATDLTPKQIGGKLAKAERLAAALHELLRHPQVEHYLDIDFIRYEAGDITRQRFLKAGDQLKREIAAVAKLQKRLEFAGEHVREPNPYDAGYFGKPSAAKPSTEVLIDYAWHYWLNVLRRPSTLSNRSSVVVFILAVVAKVTGGSVTGESLRKRLAKMAKSGSQLPSG
jgi:hypothetical protein